MIRVADAYARFSDQTLRDLDCRRIEIDEIGAFVTKKNKNVTINDLASRMRNRIQISSDGFAPYYHTIATAFGRDVDYATIVKEYRRALKSVLLTRGRDSRDAVVVALLVRQRVLLDQLLHMRMR